MSSIPFDTLKFVERLEAGGFTHVQAKAAAEAFAEATSQELPTKSDIAVIKSEIEKLELRFYGKFNLLFWMLGVLIAASASLVIKAFFHG